MKKIYLIATIVAIITGIAVFLFATELQNGNKEKEQLNMVSVVVAAIDINENSTFKAEMLTTAMFPEENVPKTAITDLSSLVGKISKLPISKGEQLLSNKVLIIGDEENNELSERVQSGYRAFTISVDEVTGIAGYLRVGDKIDIIITKQIDEVSTTQYCLQNINIIAVGSASQNVGNTGAVTTYTNITLEISAEDCIQLNHDIINGLVKIVLRGYGDKEIITTPVINK